ncbi:MAG: SIMPL domain-containing protein, partial [Dysgonamonadaceae bacterium]
TKLNDIKPKMIEEATKNARATAEKFAKDSGSKLGKIQSANQGQFSITDRDANTPHIKNIRVVSTVNYYLKD